MAEKAPDLQPVRERLDALEGLVERFFAEELQGRMEELDTLEKAKLHVAMAYCVNSLYFTFLKTQGVNPQDHPVKEELGRVRTYLRKVQDAVALRKGRSMQVDTAAAARHIKHGIGRTAKEVQESRREAGEAKAAGDTTGGSHRSTPAPRMAHLQFRSGGGGKK